MSASMHVCLLLGEEIGFSPCVTKWLHIVLSQIILNFFTAIILDNLDLDEETKVEKLKVSEDTACQVCMMVM